MKKNQPVICWGLLAVLLCMSASAFGGGCGPLMDFQFFKLPVHIFDKFKISEERAIEGRKAADEKFLQETLFILPKNDGEAYRANQILTALQAPHIHVSRQAWGARLDKEDLNPKIFSKVKRVVVFEMPSPELEKEIAEKYGIEVVVIDHHFYNFIDRRKPQSSLEQLAEFVGWPMNREDQAIAINDRSYIPGLKAMGLSEEEIRNVRTLDLVAQGRTQVEVEDAQKGVEKAIPRLKQVNGIYVVENFPYDSGILKQELAIRSSTGQVDLLEVSPTRIGFTGNPRIAQALLKFNFESFGYKSKGFDRYGGGDSNASMFFGFKPKFPPKGREELIPRELKDRIVDFVTTGKETELMTQQGEFLKPVGGKTAPLDPKEINYEIYGSENPETLVLIHGLDSATVTFSNVVGPLSQRFRVVVYDQRGHGKTVERGLDYSSEVMARDLKALIDHLGLEKVHVLGHSMGGRTAMKFAELFPESVKSVIVEDMEMMARFKSTEKKKAKNLDLAERLSKLPSHYANREELVGALTPVWGADEARSLSYRRARENTDGSMDLLFRPAVSALYGYQGNAEDFTNVLRTLKIPALFLCADPKKGSAIDPKGLQHIRENAKTAKVITIPGSGHSIHRTNPDEFLKLVTDFVAGNPH